MELQFEDRKADMGFDFAVHADRKRIGPTPFFLEMGAEHVDIVYTF